MHPDGSGHTCRIKKPIRARACFGAPEWVDILRVYGTIAVTSPWVLDE